MASIAKAIAQSKKPTFSIELWPPRTDAAAQKLKDALPLLEKLAPTFTSITYGAAGSTREKTHDLVVLVKKEARMEPMAHLTTAAHKRSELVEILKRYLDAGVDNILALKGDPPLDAASGIPAGELEHAIDLVELARSLGDFSIAVAAHPEGHPESKDLVSDRLMLARKLEIADFAITQFFFNVDDYFRLVDELDVLGVDKPVLPGIMAPTSTRTLEKMAELAGAKIPDRVHERLYRVGDDKERIKAIGVEIAVDLANELIEKGAPGIHVYTMNEASTTIEIYKRLGYFSQPLS